MNFQSTPLVELLSTSDEDLARKAIWEEAAYAELYHRHFQRIYRYLLMVCGNEADAQDLTTQTFLAALEGIASFRRESSFAAWLSGIARNKAAMLYRLRKREVPIENARDSIDPSPSPEALAMKHLQLQQVTTALHRLSPERAEAILLYLFADLSAAETAKVMNKSQGAVKMLVLRGLRELRQQLLPIQEVEN
jgi:RNA polymerase sigma-70 factor (ECF subfamily)